MIPEIDKSRMKMFYKKLKIFDPIFTHFYQKCILCVGKEDTHLIDIKKQIKLIKAQYRTLYGAFVAGEEVVILAHHHEISNYFIDGITRPSKHYIDRQPYYHGHKYLIQDEGDLLVFTMQDEFKIKRFGLISTTIDDDYLFVENSLHPDVQKAMNRLIERY